MMNSKHRLIMGIAVTALMQSCSSTELPDNANARHAVQSAEVHIGIIGASGGDIESCQELASFVTNFASDELWNMVKDRLIAEYETLADCNTNFRVMSRAQTAAMAKAVKLAIPDIMVSSYAGFRHVHGNLMPAGQTLMDAIAQAQADGVTHIFVTDQDDILFSTIMQQLGFDQISAYLKNNPEWNVRVFGFNGYSEQPGFADLLVEDIKNSVITAFPNASASDIEVILPCQGIKQANEDTDPHANQARSLAHKVQTALPQYSITFTFQNSQEKLGDLLTYSQPSEQTRLPIVANNDRHHIFISPKLQWPVTDISVLWRQQIRYRETILAIAPSKQIVNELAWDVSPSFINFASAIIADIVLDNAAYKYDITEIHAYSR